MKYIIETIWRWNYKPYVFDGKKSKTDHKEHSYTGIVLSSRRDPKSLIQYIDAIIKERDGNVFPAFSDLYHILKDKELFINTRLQQDLKNFDANKIKNENMKNIVLGIQKMGGYLSDDHIQPVQFKFSDPETAFNELDTIVELYRLIKGTENINIYQFFEDIFGIKLRSLSNPNRQNLDIRSFKARKIRSPRRLN